MNIIENACFKIFFKAGQTFKTHTLLKREQHVCWGLSRLGLSPSHQLHTYKVAPGVRAKARTLKADKLDSGSHSTPV